MFGLGGTLVEVLEDIVFRVAPLTSQDAVDMLEEIRSGKMLEGFRGGARIDKEQLAGLLVAISELMMSFERIEEVEINPLFLTSKGPVAVDARLRLSD
jgi:acetyl-CoA synthetase (ADP-forming)